MRIYTDEDKLDLNFEQDIIICDQININNNKNIENKITYIRNAAMFQVKIRKWYLRNIKHNIHATYLLIKLFWGQPKREYLKHY